MLSAPAFAQEADTAYTAVDTTATTEEVAGDATEQGDAAARPVPRNAAAPTAAQWQQLTTDKAFGYKDQKEFTPAQKPESIQEPWIIRVLLAIFRFFASVAGRIVLFGVLALLVGYVLYRILAGDGRIFGRRNKKHGEEEAADTAITEEDLLLNDWAARLHEALASGNTRMAIRYSYMQLLQLLQARDLIAYRQDKTNTAYYHQLSGNAVRQDFRQLTRQYEYAWYGNFLPSTDGFDSYMQTFNGVKKQLGAS